LQPVRHLPYIHIKQSSTVAHQKKRNFYFSKCGGITPHLLHSDERRFSFVRIQTGIDPTDLTWGVGATVTCVLFV
jgi:hypothetical protein